WSSDVCSSDLLGHVGTPVDLAETTLHRIAKTLEQIHAHQTLVSRFDRHAMLAVRRGLVPRIRGGDGESIVKGDAQQHVMDRVTRFVHTVFALKVVMLDVNEFCFEIPLAVGTCEGIDTNSTCVKRFAFYFRCRQKHEGKLSSQKNRLSIAQAACHDRNKGEENLSGIV